VHGTLPSSKTLPGVQTVHQIQIERDPTATAALDHSRRYGIVPMGAAAAEADADPGVIGEVVASSAAAARPPTLPPPTSLVRLRRRDTVTV